VNFTQHKALTQDEKTWMKKGEVSHVRMKKLGGLICEDEEVKEILLIFNFLIFQG
jgi:hypothetical protein